MARPRLLAPALLALASCRAPLPASKLAVIAPLSGPLAADGRGLERAVRLAVEDETAAGTLPRPVSVVAFDDRSEPADASEAARRAAADPAVFAVIGPLTSGCAIEAARVLARDPLPMITPSATAPELTLQQERSDWPGARVAFRLPPSDAVQGDADADYAFRRLGLRRLAVVSDATPYGRGLAESFRRGYERRGGRVTLSTSIERGARDFSAPAVELAREKPEGLFFGGVYVEAGLLLRQARAAGFLGAFLSGDGTKSDDFFHYAGDAADGAYLSVGGVPLETLPSAQDFIASYRARWPDAPPRTFDHYAYEAARLALSVLGRTRGDRKAAVEAIRESRHRSMMGTFIFDAKGDSLKSLITMTKADARRRRFDPAY